MALLTDKAARLRALVESALGEHEAALVHYTAGLLNGDIERARDVVQDAFLKLCRQDPDKVEEQVKAWLFTVCRNRAYDLLRRDNRWRMQEAGLDRLQQPDADPAEASVRRDRGRQVARALARLPKNQQDVVRLRYQQDMSYKEIARITGMSTGNVGYLLHHALKTLREMIEHEDAPATSKGGLS